MIQGKGNHRFSSFVFIGLRSVQVHDEILFEERSELNVIKDGQLAEQVS